VSTLLSQRLPEGRQPALILVDLIYGFTDPSCPLGVSADDVVESCARLIEVARHRQWPLAWTTVIYRHADQAPVFRNKLPALNLLRPGSRWVEIDARLARDPTDVLIEKCWASAFFATDLAARLRSLEVDQLVVCGLTTSGCVRATAVDGLQHDYPVIVPRQAVGDRCQAAHQANLDDLDKKYADVVDLDAWLARLPGPDTAIAE